MHLVRPYVFVELVGDDGVPVEAGRPGRVILTAPTVAVRRSCATTSATSRRVAHRLSMPLV